MLFTNTQLEDIKKISEKLHNLKEFGTNEETIKDALNYLIPENDYVKIGIDINKHNLAASFVYDKKKVEISLEKLDRIVKTSIIKLKKIYPELNEQEMYHYYILCVLVHETRHIYQYLIANNYIEMPYEIVRQAYYDLSNVGELNINPIRNFISCYLYYKDPRNLLIERNANIEAAEIIRNLANFEGEDYIKELFENMRQKNISYGYISTYNGSLEETYKKLWLNPIYEKLPKNEAIPIRDRIRYGLPINEETKKMVLEHKY